MTLFIIQLIVFVVVIATLFNMGANRRIRRIYKKESEKEALRSVIKQETKQLNTDLENIKDNTQKTNMGTDALINNGKQEEI